MKKLHLCAVITFYLLVAGCATAPQVVEKTIANIIIIREESLIYDGILCTLSMEYVKITLHIFHRALRF